MLSEQIRAPGEVETAKLLLEYLARLQEIDTIPVKGDVEALRNEIVALKDRVVHLENVQKMRGAAPVNNRPIGMRLG